MSNIARGKTYTAPTTASGYPDAGGELTDNIIPTVSPASPGWVGFDAGNPAIVIDLGSSLTVRVAIIATLFASTAGVSLPSNILVEVGDGASSWTTLGTGSPTGSDGLISLTKFTFGTGITNRYVRVTFTRVNILLVGEIAVYDDNALFPLEIFSTADSPPTQVLPSNGIQSTQTGGFNGAVLGNHPLLSSPNINSENKSNQVLYAPAVGVFGGSTLSFPRLAGIIVVSSNAVYNAGIVTVTAVLSAPAGLSCWITLGGHSISEVYTNLDPSQNHIFNIPVGLSHDERNFVIALEVVNL